MEKLLVEVCKVEQLMWYVDYLSLELIYFWIGRNMITRMWFQCEYFHFNLLSLNIQSIVTGLQWVNIAIYNTLSRGVPFNRRCNLSSFLLIMQSLERFFERMGGKIIHEHFIFSVFCYKFTRLFFWLVHNINLPGLFCYNIRQLIQENSIFVFSILDVYLPLSLIFSL